VIQAGGCRLQRRDKKLTHASWYWLAPIRVLLSGVLYSESLAWKAVLHPALGGFLTSSTTFRFASLSMPNRKSQADAVSVQPFDCAPEESDDKLMARIRKGDQAALGSLFRRYAPIVRGVAYKVLRDPSEADDLLQDVFLLIHRLCGRFDRSRGTVRFWILLMTHRRAISRRRYLTSRHFYTCLDLESELNRLSHSLTKSTRHSDAVLEALERKDTLRS